MFAVLYASIKLVTSFLGDPALPYMQYQDYFPKGIQEQVVTQDTLHQKKSSKSLNTAVEDSALFSVDSTAYLNRWDHQFFYFGFDYGSDGFGMNIANVIRVRSSKLSPVNGFNGPSLPWSSFSDDDINISIPTPFFRLDYHYEMPEDSLPSYDVYNWVHENGGMIRGVVFSGRMRDEPVSLSNRKWEVGENFSGEFYLPKGYVAFGSFEKVERYLDEWSAEFAWRRMMNLDGVYKGVYDTEMKTISEGRGEQIIVGIQKKDRFVTFGMLAGQTEETEKSTLAAILIENNLESKGLLSRLSLKKTKGTPGIDGFFDVAHYIPEKELGYAWWLRGHHSGKNSYALGAQVLFNSHLTLDELADQITDYHRPFSHAYSILRSHPFIQTPKVTILEDQARFSIA